MSKITKMFGKYKVTRRENGTIIKWEKLKIPEIPLTDEKFQELPLTKRRMK